MSKSPGNVSVYDRIGQGYARHRRPDPRWAATIRSAIGSGPRVVNVGAGTGSYEPTDLEVTAVEPSLVMIAQRDPSRGRAVQAAAEHLPFEDSAFDVALAVLTIHHWTDWQAGLAELRRVAQRHVVVTFDPNVHARTWLVDRYLPEAAALDHERTPAVDDIAETLGDAKVVPLLVPSDMQDAVLAAHWSRPDAYLDPSVRAATSGFAQLPNDTVARAIRRLESDLADGTWDHSNGHLRRESTYDAGYRLLVT
jgi:SAM-dependent methyltransferase